LNPEISPWPSDLFSWSGAGSGTDPNIVLTFDTEGSETLTANFAGCSSETIDINILEPIVYTIGFGGDHAMYETPDPNVWENGKTLISDPVYVNDAANSKNDSVCVTKNSSSIYLYTVKLKVSEDLSFATPIVVDARGTVWWNEDEIQISGLVSEEAELDIKESVINKIKKYDNNFQIEWRYKVPSDHGTNSWYDIETTNHTLYVTYGMPEPNSTNEITEKRIDFVCKAANDRISISNAAIAVHDALKPESAEPNSPKEGPDPIWLIHTGKPSQCPGLAMYINAHFMMLGLGEGEIRYCYAKADGTCAYETESFIHDERRYNPVPGHDPNTNHFDICSYEMLIMSDGVHANNYQSTCYHSETSVYYALVGNNTARWFSPADVVTSLFYMIWIYVEDEDVYVDCPEVPWSQ